MPKARELGVEWKRESATSARAVGESESVRVRVSASECDKVQGTRETQKVGKEGDGCPGG